MLGFHFTIIDKFLLINQKLLQLFYYIYQGIFSMTQYVLQKLYCWTPPRLLLLLMEISPSDVLNVTKWCVKSVHMQSESYWCYTSWWCHFDLLQPALAPLEQVLPQEVPVGCQIGAFLLAGHHPGVPQHSHHIIGAWQPASVADTSARYEQLYAA